MRQQICLQGQNIKNQAQLLNAVKRCCPGLNVRYKTKEKLLAEGDSYKYRSAVLKRKLPLPFTLKVNYGIFMVNDKLYPVADVVFTFDDEEETAALEVKRILGRLLAGKLKYVLEEPDMKSRAVQLRGSFRVKEHPYYDGAKAETFVLCHLPWQLYSINKAWYQLLCGSGDKALVRQLRVKLRRIRACYGIAKKLLPKPERDQWQERLKARTDILAATREYDVALMTCMKMRLNDNGIARSSSNHLEQVLRDIRHKAAASIIEGEKINSVTKEMAELLLFLYTAPLQERYAAMALQEYLGARFHKWYEDILQLPEQYPDFDDMEQLHKIRIRIRRFRYALQYVPELAPTMALWRSLKNIQDNLGSLHDDYVNGQLIRDVLAQTDDQEVRLEGAVYSGWEQANAVSAQAILPLLWSNLVDLLTEWHEGYSL